MKHGGDPARGDAFSLDGDKSDVPAHLKKPGSVVVYNPRPHLPGPGDRTFTIIDPSGANALGQPYGWHHQTIAFAASAGITPGLGSSNYVNIGRATDYPSIEPDFRATYRGLSHGFTSYAHGHEVLADVRADVHDKRLDLTVSNPRFKNSNDHWIPDQQINNGQGFTDQLSWNSQNRRFEGALPGNNAAFYGPNGAEIGGQFDQPVPRELIWNDPAIWNDPHYKGAYGAVRVID